MATAPGATTCPSCGAGNTPDARFCASCGQALAEPCASCGTALAPGARFCSACGQPVATGRPAEERKFVTVLFADLVGSTQLGESLDAEHLKDLLDAFFNAMREEIEAQGGTVEKFIGDAIMAVFGVPVAHEDDPVRALRAALGMRGRLDEVNEQAAARHGVQLELRIGVNTGDVVAVVAPAPGEPMVAGDVVNTAARLEQGAEPGQILASRAHRALGARHALRGGGHPRPARPLAGRARLRARRRACRRPRARHPRAARPGRRPRRRSSRS